MAGSLAPELNVLKKYIFGTVPKLARDLGVSERVIRYLMGWPRHHSASPLVRSQITSLFTAHYPFPLPDGLADLRLMLNAAKQRPGSQELLVCVQTIEYTTQLNQLGEWAQIGALYLYFAACHARAMLNNKQSMFGNEKSFRQILDRGIDALEKARKLVADTLQKNPHHPDMKKIRELDAYLLLNHVTARGFYITDETEIRKDEVTAELKEINAIELFLDAMLTAPWEWRLAYNGLDVANRLNQPDDILMKFYGPLMSFDRGFSDVAYSPGEVLSIEKNPDWGHLRQRLKNKRFKDLVSAHLNASK
ncbi:hypothetical protein [Bosea sp. MMO-172]|uniref:hypothetical protein n=1 Tax=Bosea sp. MMO-172 TaxID=3127885 RepID=UPI003018AFAB